MLHRINQFALLLMALALCANSALFAFDGANNVVVDIAKLRKLAPTALYSGTVLSKNDVELPAELAGRIVSVADIGTRLNKGDIVAQLDDTFIKQQRTEELANIKSEQARLDLHTKEVKRFQRLIKKNNVAESELDQSISDQAIARSNIVAANARLAQIDEQLRRTKIRAPFNGVISEKLIDAGEWAQDGMSIARLVDLENLEIQINVPQAIVTLLSEGDELTIQYAGELIKAHIITIVPVGSNNSRLFELRLDPEQAISPGVLVRVIVPTAHAQKVLAIPRDALVLRKGSVSVFKVNNENTAEQIAVTIGIGYGDYVAVSGAISAGDRVITRGGERIRPGMPVNITNLDAL